MKIDSSEFGQIMGVPEGGSEVDLSGSIEVSRVEKSVEELKDIVVGTVSTKIASELKELLKVLKDKQDTEQKNEDTSANHEDNHTTRILKNHLVRYLATTTGHHMLRTEDDHLPRMAIRCLEPGKLVSSQSIAIHAAQEGHAELLEFGATARKRFTPIFQHAKGLKDCEKIFIPILDTATEPHHWFLMIWALDAIFEAENYCLFQKKWKFCSFTVRRPDCVPIQPNGFDCGIFMLKFMIDYDNASQIVGDEFDSINERVQLALRLLKHPNNLALSDIDKAMQESLLEDTIGTSAKRKTKTIKEIDEGMKHGVDENKGNKCTKVVKKERDVQKEEPLLPAKRGRGRPPGAKNKLKKQDKK
ncbi:hypothetical protein M0R45_020058 [Rubus argutus]|uniref:Ubiquitin-like protease family profile domain-containing protein n=1 Tax=Rubus argutus TaxID=59490 RepID=A0AAW1X765_RUBAR